MQFTMAYVYMDGHTILQGRDLGVNGAQGIRKVNWYCHILNCNLSMAGVYNIVGMHGYRSGREQLGCKVVTCKLVLKP